MKKKIKDLTSEEKEKICVRHFSCRFCPLRLANGKGSFACAYDEEIEVDESNND